MKKNLTKQDYENMYPYENAYAMMYSRDLRMKLTKQSKMFTRTTKPIFEITMTDFMFLQDMCEILKDVLRSWISTDTKDNGMTIRINDIRDDDNKPHYATFSITSSIPHYFRSPIIKVVRVISSNVYVSNSDRILYNTEGLSTFEDNREEIFKKPNFLAIAVDINAPDDINHAAPQPALSYLPFCADGETDDPNSPFYKFCHSKASVVLAKSIGEISILIKRLYDTIPDEFYNKIFEELPNGDLRLHMNSRDVCNVVLPLLENSLLRKINKGIISAIPELDRLIDDEITLDESGVDKLISLWRGDEHENIPSDLIRDDTVPMIGCAIKYKDKTYKIVTRVLDDSDAVVRGSADVAGYIELRYPNGYTVSKNISYAKDKTELRMPKVGIDEVDSNRILKAWYGIQLSLMHPIIKTALEDKCSRNSIATETTNHKSSNKKQTERHIRHYYNITGETLTKILDGNCRHNHRHTMSWYVIGHWRKYKDGHQIFINGHWRGPLRETYSSEIHRKRDIDM